MQVLAHVLFKSTMGSILVSRKLGATKKNETCFRCFFIVFFAFGEKSLALSQLLMEKYMRDTGSGTRAFSKVQQGRYFSQKFRQTRQFEHFFALLFHCVFGIWEKKVSHCHNF